MKGCGNYSMGYVLWDIYVVRWQAVIHSCIATSHSATQMIKVHHLPSTEQQESFQSGVDVEYIQSVILFSINSAKSMFSRLRHHAPLHDEQTHQQLQVLKHSYILSIFNNRQNSQTPSELHYVRTPHQLYDFILWWSDSDSLNSYKNPSIKVLCLNCNLFLT